jgi:drug/metabolite transporter (DMT)-like permease
MVETTPLSSASPAAPPLRAYIVLAVGLMAVSAAAILIRLALNESVPSLVIAAGRLSLAALILTPITLRRYRAEIRALKRGDVLMLGISGLFLAMHFATWVSSLEYTSVLISVVLVTTTPIWVGLLEVLVLRARLSRGIVIGLIVAMTGGLLIAIYGDTGAAIRTDGAWLGGLLSLIGAMTVAVYMVIGRRMRATLSLLPYIWIVYGIAALLLLAVVIIMGIPVTGYSTTGYLWVLALALIPQLIGHSSFNYALAYLPATYIGLSTQLEPIGSAMLAFFLFGELPTEMQIVGSAVILVGVSIATLRPARSNHYQRRQNTG